MKGSSRRRGVSVGTIVMLALTVVVLSGLGHVLIKLTGSSALDTSKVLEALKLDELFQLTLNDIPLQSVAEAPSAVPEQAQPQVTPEPPVLTEAPTLMPTVTPNPGGTVRLTIGGSVCVEDNVRQSGYYKDSKKYDLDEVLSLIAGEMTSDVTLMTLENLVYADGKVSPLIAPQAALRMLKSAGVNTIGLGFAKALDKGVDPLAQTVRNAREEGLHVIGAFEQESEAALSGQITEVGGVKVALLHYTDGLSSATKKKLNGQEWLLPTSDRATEDIARARQMGAQVVVVSMFWGKSGSTSVTKTQKTLAQQLSDAGADVIVGTGCRVVQPAVWLTRPDGGETLCCYGLGSLVSDSRSDAGVAGMLLHVTVNVDGTGNVTIPSPAYTPTYVWRYKQDGAYHYRVVACNGDAPDGMDDAQKTSRERAMKNVQKYLGEDNPLTLWVQAP